MPKHRMGMKKSNKDKGSAMIVALVVCVVVMTMCLTLLLVTYTLFAQTSKQNVQMQCKNLAQSFSECFEKELEDPNSDLVKYLNELMSSNIPEKRWQAIDADENTDPNYNENAMTELVLGIQDVEGYLIRVTATYELADPIDVDENGNPIPTVSENGIDGNEEENKSMPLATFTITCQRGEFGDRQSDSYSVISYYNIPVIE